MTEISQFYQNRLDLSDLSGFVLTCMVFEPLNVIKYKYYFLTHKSHLTLNANAKRKIGNGINQAEISMDMVP